MESILEKLFDFQKSDWARIHRHYICKIVDKNVAEFNYKLFQIYYMYVMIIILANGKLVLAETELFAQMFLKTIHTYFADIYMEYCWNGTFNGNILSWDFIVKVSQKYNTLSL